MLQAPRFECLSFDPFGLLENVVVTPEVAVSGCNVVVAFVVALMTVVIDEGFDLSFEITWQEVVNQQDEVLEGVMRSIAGQAIVTFPRKLPSF